MRNLLGRLNARSSEELERIAAAWKVPVTASDRPALLGQLFRELHDPRTVRDCWERLPYDEREMVHLLAVAEDAPELSVTLADLARLLRIEESEARATATRLYQKGILAREGGTQPLPIDEKPRLFLPRELALLFRRIQDEIEAGDVSGSSFSALIELLDDADVQRAAEIWGYKVVPGLMTRKELTERLLELVTEPEVKSDVEKRLGWDARRIYSLVRAGGEGKTVSLRAAAEAAELSKEDARTAHRLRQVLAELEESMLVWHTYRADGSRWLFMAQVAGAGKDESRSEVLPPVPLEQEPALQVGFVHPAALAWDLLTLLREMGAGSGSGVRQVDDISRRQQRELNDRLWMHGQDLPPGGYLEFLLALAASEGVAETEPENETTILLGKAWKIWRNRSFAEQLGHLLYWWLAAPTWIEAAGQHDVIVHGAIWPQFRRRIMVLLSELDPEQWYRLEDVSAWLALRDSEMLGDEFEIATARPVDSTLDLTGRRRSAVNLVVEQTLRTGFSWFGLIQMGHIPEVGEVVRITEAVRGETGAAKIPEFEGAAEDRFLVQPDLSILLGQPTPLRVWALSAFADQSELGPVTRYVLTESSLTRALSEGFRVEDVTQFLERQSGRPLPDEVSSRLVDWAASYGRVWMSPAMLLQPEQPESLEPVRRELDAAGFRVTQREADLLVEMETETGPDELERKITEALKKTGRSPQPKLLRVRLHDQEVAPESDKE